LTIDSENASFSNQAARLIVAQAALDHVLTQESSIKQALQSCCPMIPDAAYLIQVGFNEDLIQSQRGILQEVHIFVNFDFQKVDVTRILDRLGQILSPFPCVIATPSACLQPPILGPNGKPVELGELWASFDSHKVFWCEESVQIEDHWHLCADQLLKE
jgi:hypothetical protein